VERYKIEVRFELCSDGRLRVWSPDVPGFRLSHHDHKAVMADIRPALEGLLGERLGAKIRVLPLEPLSARESGMTLPPIMPMREYVSEIAA
jgi:hypothetical protein